LSTGQAQELAIPPQWRMAADKRRPDGDREARPGVAAQKPLLE
jgi:hypothetical protein